MRIIACGGRNFMDREFVFAELDKLHAATPITLLVEGGAKGADMLAMSWALWSSVDHISVRADWQKCGKRAGPMRNAAMLAHGVDLVVAFPGGTGTADMVKQAKKAGVKVLELKP